MLRKLLAEHPNEFEEDHSTFDKLVRAQHYGLPTRLLDISSNPLVGLYFACKPARLTDEEEKESATVDGQIIVFSTPNDRQKYFDSDVVSLLANLSLIPSETKAKIYTSASKCYNFIPTTEAITKLQECTELGFLSHSVRGEKPGFRDQIDPLDLLLPVPVTPRKSHERIKAQDGHFILFGLNPDFMKIETIEETSMDLFMPFNTINIPSSSKEGILAELKLVGISEKTLFPEIGNTAKQIKDSYK